MIQSMKRIVFVLLGMFLVLSSFSQKNFIQVKKNVCEYVVDSTLYSQIDFYYSNTSDSAYVLWIERDEIDSLSNLQKIRKHFHNHEGEASLMGIILDGNVWSFVPGLFNSFMKVIQPKEHFIVSILKEGKIVENSDNINSIEKQIVIVNANEIRGLPIDKSIDMFSYSAKSVAINNSNGRAVATSAKIGIP